MKSREIIERARAQVNRGTSYILGGGKSAPLGDNPRDENDGCDCSAFVCWVLGIDKAQPGLAWLKRVNGGWYNTDGIWWDAAMERTGFFTKPDRAIVGDVIVYPSDWMVRKWWADLQSSKKLLELPRRKVGHVGIVSEVEILPSTGAAQMLSSRVTKVIHCSAGNDRRTGDAIAETDASVFNVQGTIFAHPACLEL
jgi:hypothetical protein